jgi:hypothetical protein
VLAFWDTFNIEIDCSVMRLSCLDELLNNYFVNQPSSLSLKEYCYLCHSRDMISKEGDHDSDGTFGLYRLMFCFCLSFGRNDNISFGWNFVREE